MKNYSHLDHWPALFCTRRKLLNALDKELKESKFLFGRNMSFNYAGKDYIDAEIFAIEKKDGPIAIRSLIYYDKEAEENKLISTFPIGEPLEECGSVELRHTIDQWQNKIEANIEGELVSKNWSTLNFYSTDYLMQKPFVRLTHSAKYSLVAFGLRCELASQKDIRFEGQEALDFLKKINREPQFDENGEVVPVIINKRNMVSFLPTHPDTPDIMQFHSPISHIESFTSFDVSMYRMTITIARSDSNLNITLYARQHFFRRTPRVGDAIEGVIWLQGHTATDLLQVLEEDEKGKNLSEVTDNFFAAANKVDPQNGFDNLTPLMESFKDLKVKDGFELDGFWADCGENSYIKLYFSTKGTTLRWMPQIVDGKPDSEFRDNMFIHNHLDESIVQNLPPLTNYIEGPFTPEAIWQAYLLLTAKHYLPITKGLRNERRYPLIRKIDFLKLDDERLSDYANDNRLRSEVDIIDKNRALVSCALWSGSTGLCVEKVVVSRAGNGYKFGTFRTMPID